MAQPNGDRPTVGFKSVRLFETQTLGTGAYGFVCKALCDDLLCAAKILHPNLTLTEQPVVGTDQMQKLPTWRFERECEVMSAIRHPNIVLYLGTHHDPKSGQPVLLMELMDDSLTHYLENLYDSVPYHMQVNYCHDIALAIAFLHANEIVHRDLSSNNVLLCGNVKAKVADFGMAKLGDVNRQTTRASLTTLPGTEVYMPPNAMDKQCSYTAKIDCFSIGVLIIQILTRLYPKPGERHKNVNTIDPKFPTLRVCVPEIERRQNHTSLVDPNHLLLPIALNCLMDKDGDRPSAQELCHWITTVKETHQYTECVTNAQDSRLDKNKLVNGELSIGSQTKQHYLRQQLDKAVEEIKEKDRRIQQMSEQLEIGEQVTAQFQTRIQDLELLLKVCGSEQPNNSSTTQPECPASLSQTRAPSQSHYPESQRPEVRESGIKLRWKRAKKAPCEMYKDTDAVVSGDFAYFRAGGTRDICVYNSTNDSWSQIPDCPASRCSLAVINQLLTTVGGELKGRATNQLFTFGSERGRQRWRETYPVMPTKRCEAVSLCHETTLIVAGGVDQDRTLIVIEVLDLDTRQWFSTSPLPVPLFSASAALCGNDLFILGRTSDQTTDTMTKQSVLLTQSLTAIGKCCKPAGRGLHLSRALSFNSQPVQAGEWKRVDHPVSWSSCVSFQGRLLAVGVEDSSQVPTPAVHLYDPSTDMWDIVSNMSISRRRCFAAALPNNQLMVVGGYTTQVFGSVTEIANLV